MYLHFNLRRMKCLRSTDSGKSSEFYFTWRGYVEEKETIQLAQGFSLGCPIDNGYALRTGEQRALNDPKFTVNLPDVAEGETQRFTLDLFAWESDHSTDETKKLFTNAATEQLMKIHAQSKENKKKVRDSFLKWVQDGDNELIAALVATGIMAASSVVPYVAIAKAAVKLMSWGVEVVKSNSDDYLGFSRSEVIYTRKNGKVLYRWIFNDGVETWLSEERPAIHQDWRVLEANRDNEIDCKFSIQIVESNPNEFTEPPPE